MNRTIRILSLTVLLMMLMIAVPGQPVASAALSQKISPESVAERLSGETRPEVGEVNPYFTFEEVVLEDGTRLLKSSIAGPPNPPAEYEAARIESILPLPGRDALVDFPSYNWVFGCSAVSGAMIAGYYDRNGYPNMYSGPTNEGVMPLTDTSWPQWYSPVSDPYDPYPNNPLVASKMDVDGCTVKGSIDDYWVKYASTASDPYIGHWTQHTWGTAIGDYMKTSQSAYGNSDGETAFYTYISSSAKLTCSFMEDQDIDEEDGTFGRKLFYEARGYDVTNCYNQVTDNKIAGGFSLANFKTEIDAGHPVLLNLEGHSIVGYGYSGSTMYIRDTWDSNPNNTYTMPWGGCLPIEGDCLDLYAVSIVRLASTPALPGAFVKVSPSDGVDDQPMSLTLTWSSSSGATSYEYCYDTTDDNACSGWTSNGTNTSSTLTGLDEDTTYYWHVRARNSGGVTYSNGSNTAFWLFRTLLNPPGSFSKATPINDASLYFLGATLAWDASANATSYDYCFATIAIACSNWISNGASTNKHIAGLSPSTTYYWHVRANNSAGTTYSNEDVLWRFTTGNPDDAISIYLPIIILSSE